MLVYDSSSCCCLQEQGEGNLPDVIPSIAPPPFHGTPRQLVWATAVWWVWWGRGSLEGSVRPLTLPCRYSPLPLGAPLSP